MHASDAGETQVEQPSFELVPGHDACGVLFLCDHASNALPEGYGSLGLPPQEFERHIAYDIGAAQATRYLADRFGAPALLTRYSRLLIDPNRGGDDPTLVMRLSDGCVVPGNARIDAAEVEHRRQLYWQPYRDAVRLRLDAMLATGKVPVIVSIHSFTPVWRGHPRPWHIAVLWDSDPRIARPIIASMQAEGLTVGDNEPYDGALIGDTLYEHGTLRGLPHVLVEFRQDLIRQTEGAREWAERLARHLDPVLANPDTHMIEHYASRADRHTGSHRK